MSWKQWQLLAAKGMFCFGLVLLGLFVLFCSGTPGYFLVNTREHLGILAVIYPFGCSWLLDFSCPSWGERLRTGPRPREAPSVFWGGTRQTRKEVWEIPQYPIWRDENWCCFCAAGGSSRAAAASAACEFHNKHWLGAGGAAIIFSVAFSSSLTSFAVVLGWSFMQIVPIAPHPLPNPEQLHQLLWLGWKCC